MEYKAEFGFYREDDEPISDEVLNELTDAWVQAIEDRGLWTGGGIGRFTRTDVLLDWLWVKLWRFKWLRHAA